MKPVHFVCVCLILAGTVVLAQFGSAPPTNQPNGMSNAQEPQSGVPANPSRMRQGATFARRGSSVLKATARRLDGMQASGLNFESFGEYGVGGPDLSVATWVVVADVNGDGKPDLLLTATSDLLNSPFGIVAVLLGNGDGTFQTEVDYASGGGSATSVVVGDVSGDGKADLLVANGVSGTVGVLLGNGDGIFQTAVTYGSGGYNATSVAVADLNGDGKPDLVVANACISISNCANGTIGVLLNNGDGTFRTAVTYGSGGYEGLVSTMQVAVSDVNDDDRPDLLVSNVCVSSNSCANGTGNNIVRLRRRRQPGKQWRRDPSGQLRCDGGRHFYIGLGKSSSFHKGYVGGAVALIQGRGPVFASWISVEKSRLRSMTTGSGFGRRDPAGWAGGPDNPAHLTLEGAPSKLRLGGVFPQLNVNVIVAHLFPSVRTVPQTRVHFGRSA